MKEYTALAVFSVFLTLVLDRVMKISILRKREFYLFLFVIFCFKMLVNGFLTGNHIVMYNPAHFLGIRLASIPLEDFLFGFSMVTTTIVFWEYFKRRD